jgi:hypothetical protein
MASPAEQASTLETFTSVTSCDAGTSRAILEVRDVTFPDDVSSDRPGRWTARKRAAIRSGSATCRRSPAFDAVRVAARRLRHLARLASHR